MASTSTLRLSLSRWFQTPAAVRSIFSSPPGVTTSTITSTQCPSRRAFSTTPTAPARNDAPRPVPGGGAPPSALKRTPKTRGRQPQQDPKIVSMKKSLILLSPRFIPPPLRMARNRHLRHWTIHRAWMLFRRKQRDAHERELMRMHQGMRSACEELRTTEGPGTREEGYLYRVAMEKIGVYGKGGVPIEYARMQTETPAREPWNHGWKRT